jgi:hypothetical protein
MLILRNLTEQQIKMLDIIWAINSMDDVNNYLAGFPVLVRQDMYTLIKLLQLQFIDDHVDEGGDLDMAQNLLAPFMK